MSGTGRCLHCGAPVQYNGSPPPRRSWCSPEHMEAWCEEHPEPGWVRVEDAPPHLLAEVVAITGKGCPC